MPHRKNHCGSLAGSTRHGAPPAYRDWFVRRRRACDHTGDSAGIGANKGTTRRRALSLQPEAAQRIAELRVDGRKYWPSHTAISVANTEINQRVRLRWKD